MQLIEFSTEGVAGDSRETLVALFILLFFAVISAIYVFRKGMEKGNRTTHELLVKAILIITSVVPRQLPMQMALAVNQALMALMKTGIMCTEPYRVPLAGKITHCLFDKTGTLTTDTLVPAGVVNPPGDGRSHPMKSAGVRATVPVKDAAPEAAMVIAACHSLLHMEGQGIVGDPIELAGLRGVEWRYDAEKQIAKPGNWEAKEATVSKLQIELKGLDKHPARKKEVEKQIADLSASVRASQDRAKRDRFSAQIVHRHHFSSKLQRMSVVARIESGPGGRSGLCALVKGSSEQLTKLFSNDTPPPPWFEATYKSLMEEGSRVLALGYKWWPSGADPKRAARSEVECELRFAGFVAFSCRVRTDTPDCVLALREAQHEVAMVTGDGSLTALHVARSVGICDRDAECLALEPLGDGGAEWVSAVGEDKRHLPLRYGDGVGTVRELAARHVLMITEAALDAALDGPSGERIWEDIGLVKIFARMSPQGKATVIRNLQEKDKDKGTQLATHVLMCGDGGNDVGALKQADVGIALLCGYGNANTGEATADAADRDDGQSAEERLNKLQDNMMKKSRDTNNVRKELMGKKQKDMMSKQQEWLKEEIERLDPKGTGGVMVQVQATKNVLAKFKTEMQKEAREVHKVGDVYSPGVDDVLAQAEADTLLIRPGDASVAAPFTSRLPSIRATVDLIRQGRCTLLSALQQQQIMMLESLIQAFTLSALSLEGARQSERQMLASGWLLSIASLAFSYSSPIQRMHPSGRCARSSTLPSSSLWRDRR